MQELVYSDISTLETRVLISFFIQSETSGSREDESTMGTKQFKTESKRILDLMINSIYTHKEIFLRELISNASDALDKLYFRSLTDSGVGMSREDFAIDLKVDQVQRTLTISDNGCGMTKEDLENNLGTIARSGTLNFKKENELGEDVDVIGQFGVGFYAAFMVSKKVTVISRAYGEEQAWKWVSKGVEGYTVTEAEKGTCGTDVILELKDDTEDEKYGEFLDQYRISAIVRKYSDYIRYPIRMPMTREQLKEGSKDEYETVTEIQTLNSMIPLWRKQKSELKDEDYNSFYKEKFYDFTDPLKVIHTRAEGAVTYTALLYIPAKAPYNYYTKEFEKGLQLYSNGVMIMDKCADLLPDYFSFVRGLVDSQDLSLNISREMLQHDRQLRAIEKSLEKKIKAELVKLLKDDRETYEKFYQSFGLQLKFGVYQGYGENKDFLQELLMFHSLNENKLVTLAEYVASMKEDQKYIYYACGETIARIGQLPQLELLKDKGYDVLCLTDDVDEFVMRMLVKFEEKELRSVASGDLGLETEEEKKAAEEQSSEKKELLDFLKEKLDGKVAAVRLSQRLKSHPVCLTSQGELSLEMEKVLNAMPVEQKVKAERVLELNPNHPVFQTLCNLFDTDREKLGQYADLLYDQALLIEGLPLEDPVAFSNRLCELMSE